MKTNIITLPSPFISSDDEKKTVLSTYNSLLDNLNQPMASTNESNSPHLPNDCCISKRKRYQLGIILAQVFAAIAVTVCVGLLVCFLLKQAKSHKHK